jgi:hypothetical protein
VTRADLLPWFAIGVVAAFGLYGAREIFARRRAERRAAQRDVEMLNALVELRQLEELDLKPWQPRYQRRLQLIAYVEGHALEVPR